ncbi:uncharacterized protein LOC114073994 [Solanum pennellii]|uniref:Uncharacterized protein LOC114073994 n=1 Tax=Solanum pennellii TaxID=28526 RepID=A0ABM1UW27_SOLPN|nr:uncharacterized protein LOC114073994 [Solanum pennellii]
MVRGREVECHSEHINDVLGRLLHSVLPYEGLPIAASLDDLKEWLAPMISEDTDKWIGVGASIEKMDLNIAVRFWFGFIRSTVMPSQNEYVLCLPKKACLSFIVSRRSINLGLLMSQEMAIRAKQKQTSLPFPILITELCRCAGASLGTAIDIEVIPSSSTDIWRIEVEYTGEEADRRKVAPKDTTLEVNVDLLLADAYAPTPTSRSPRTSTHLSCS